MTYDFLVHPEAEQDLLEAREWYEQQSSGLGDQFMDAIEVVFERIKVTPEIYATEYKSVRRVVLHRFPYVVYYRILAGTVEVLAVGHGRRDARKWWWRT